MSAARLRTTTVCRSIAVFVQVDGESAQCHPTAKQQVGVLGASSGACNVRVCSAENTDVVNVWKSVYARALRLRCADADTLVPRTVHDTVDEIRTLAAEHLRPSAEFAHAE